MRAHTHAPTADLPITLCGTVLTVYAGLAPKTHRYTNSIVYYTHVCTAHASISLHCIYLI